MSKVIIKFQYDKKIDKKCWNRYEEFIKKNQSVWGMSRKIKPIIEINKVDFDMDVSDIIEKYNAVFKIKVPKIKGFVVTTPFSMINDDEKFDASNSTIFYSIYTPNPSVVIGHELFHIYFEKYTKRQISNYDESKEYFTVIMNDIFNANVSGGYPNHKKIREKILKIWQKTLSIDKCIDVLNKK